MCKKHVLLMGDQRYSGCALSFVALQPRGVFLDDGEPRGHVRGLSWGAPSWAFHAPRTFWRSQEPGEATLGARGQSGPRISGYRETPSSSRGLNAAGRLTWLNRPSRGLHVDRDPPVTPRKERLTGRGWGGVLPPGAPGRLFPPPPPPGPSTAGQENCGLPETPARTLLPISS